MSRSQCSEKSIVREGLPELAPVTSSASGIPSKNEAHEQATIVFDENRPFGVFNNLRDKLDTSLQSRVWVNITAEKHPARNVLPLQVNDELTIQEYVSQVLKDIIGTLSNVLRVQVVVQKEMQFNGQKADLWVLLAMGVPIGVVEVKKSGSSPNDMKVSSTKKVVLDDSVVAGQLYDYMKALRLFYGLDHVFGIVTTYREWRIFWLEDTEDVARETDLAKVPLPAAPMSVDLRPAIPVQENRIEALVSNLDRVTLSDAAGPQPSPASANVLQDTRRLRAGRIMPWNDCDLVLTLATVIIKMATSTTTKRAVLFERGRVYPYVTASAFKWQTPSAAAWPTFNARMPRVGCTDFYILAHLGDGVNGRAYLAMTTSGSGAVLKFPRGSHKQADIVDGPMNWEATLWQKVWDVNARVQLLVDTAVLVMPYYRTCQCEDDRTAEAKAAARAAVQQMVSRGWEQNDIKWEHVGLYMDRGGTLKAVLVDLGDVSPVKPEDRAAAEQRMLRLLGLL